LNFDLVSLNFDSDIFALSEVLMYNSSDELYKGDVEIEDLDNRLSNIESGENLVKCNEPEPVDMQEVNELMNEISSTYDIELGMPFVHTTSFTVGIIRF
jgi:hypothetical protein